MVVLWAGFCSTALADFVVSAAPLKSLSEPVSRSAPATAVSLRNAVVSSRLSAEVRKMSLVPGDMVRQGEVLATLSCEDSQLTLDAARSHIAALKARQNLARQQLKRLNKLKQNRNASEEQINQRQAEVAVISAEISTQSIAIKTAALQVSRCQVVAPFPGLVTDTQGQVGNFLMPGSPIVSLVDIEQVELKAGMLESRSDELVSNPAVFEFANKQYPVTIRTVFPVVDTLTQTREVRLNFLDQKPAPGSIGRLRWTLDRFNLPATYLQNRNGKLGVFVIDQPDVERARFVILENARAGQPTVVDLDSETLIVTKGRFGLSEDLMITVEQIQ